MKANRFGKFLIIILILTLFIASILSIGSVEAQSLTWTEAFSSFTPTGTEWQNYDLYTEKSVPKGAIALIVCLNTNDAEDRTLGVRTDGSALSRYLLIHEAEGGGSGTVAMFVKCDVSTGLIETYCDSTTGVSYVLLGYFEGVDFTEKIQSFRYDGVNDTWGDVNLYSLYSVPKGSVCQVLCANNIVNVNINIGVRTDGSSLERLVLIDEAEGSAGSNNCYSMCVKTSVADGIIETHVYNGGVGFTDHYYLLGYFSTAIDYVEKMVTRSATGSDSVWTEWDLTSELDQDGRILDLVLTHQDSGAETNCGARIAGGADLARMIAVEEAEGGGFSGFECTTQSSSSGIIDIYCDDISESGFILAGYFKVGVTGNLYIVDFTQSVSTAYTLAIQSNFKANFAQAITTTLNILIQSVFAISPSISFAFSWVAEAYISMTVALSMSFSMVWNVFAGWFASLNFSQTISMAWNVLFQWNTFSTLTQTISTSWNVMVQSIFNLPTSLSLSFTWVIEAIKGVGTIAYIADLAMALETTWNILNQWSANINLFQSLTISWDFLVQSAFIIQTSLISTFTWAIDIFQSTGGAINYIIDLTLGVGTSWTLDLIQGTSKIVDLVLQIITSWNINILEIRINAILVGVVAAMFSAIIVGAIAFLFLMTKRRNE